MRKEARADRGGANQTFTSARTLLAILRLSTALVGGWVELCWVHGCDQTGYMTQCVLRRSVLNSLVPSLHCQLFFACCCFFSNMQKEASSGDWVRGYTRTAPVLPATAASSRTLEPFCSNLLSEMCMLRCPLQYATLLSVSRLGSAWRRSWRLRMSMRPCG